MQNKREKKHNLNKNDNISNQKVSPLVTQLQLSVNPFFINNTSQLLLNIIIQYKSREIDNLNSNISLLNSQIKP
jgi:hypothetical protein